MYNVKVLVLLTLLASNPLWGALVAYAVRGAARVLRSGRSAAFLAAGLTAVVTLAGCGGASRHTQAIPLRPGVALYACIAEQFNTRYVGGDLHVALVRAALALPAVGTGASDADAERLDGGAAPGKIIARGHIDAVPAPALTPVPNRYTRAEYRAAVATANASAVAASAAALQHARVQAHQFATALFAKQVDRSLQGSDLGACLGGGAAFFASHPGQTPILVVSGRLVPEGPQTALTGVDLRKAAVHLVFYCEETAQCPARLQAFRATLSRLDAGSITVSPPEDLALLTLV